MKRHFVAYQKLVFLLLIFMIVCRGVMFLNPSIGIDTEVMIALKDVFYDSWYGIGRYGLVLLKQITDTMTFNPYFTGIGVLFLLPVACILWIWLFDSVIGQNNKIGALFFSLILIASTILTEQFYFKLQALEICIGFCLLPVSVYLVNYSFKKVENKYYRILFLFAVLGINCILFSLYQVMVPLYIATVAMVMYLYVFFGDGKSENAKIQWKTLGGFVAVFICSFVLNEIIVKVFFAKGDDYIGTQIYWNTDGIGPCISNIFLHGREVALGTQIYYAKTYSIYALVLFIFTCHRVIVAIRKKELGKNMLGILSFIGIMFAPFYMTFLCGRAPVIRSQLVYPFVLAFMGYVVFLLPVKEKIYLYVMLLLGGFTILLQVKYTAMLNYSDSVRYESDVRIASEMIQEIDALQDDKKTVPVVFFGKHQAELNPSCIRGEVIGYSFFEWDTEVEPQGMFNTRRVLAFFNTLGRNYPQANEEQTESVQKYLNQMKNWPEDGSIMKKDNVIIVKLSNIE